MSSLYLKHLMKKYHISNGYDVAKALYMSNPIFFLNYYNDQKFSGGGRLDSEIYKFKNYTFIIYTDTRTKDIEFFIKVNNDLDDPSNCMLLLLDRKNHMININSVSYNKGCAIEGLQRNHGGSIILNLVLEYINKIKDKYDIRYITLMDNSMKICEGKKISLSIMYTLMHGITWYGKYGFTPYDQFNDNATKILKKKYENNMNIMKKTKLGDVPILKKYLLDAHKKIKPNVLFEDIMFVYETMIKRGKLLLDFLRVFLKDFDNTCLMFNEFYYLLYDHLKLFDFHGKGFIKKLFT